ncbi:MAG: 1-aminocyclopropane-1-carboxylate deaminase/D-cysteine desulfhydrase [Flavobacteriaceae bacterium]|nr:1-aminocyclopropane-1-carboxylate deaminase/D-cysteine desulfhydrase [Flavobacteriaceae bacterium]
MRTENQQISTDLFSLSGYSLSLKREDRIHEVVSGNKFRKLKYPLQDMMETGKEAILTFGGAYSNHIAAVAEAGRLLGIKTVGLIRGEELKAIIPSNPTLQFAAKCGMKLIFMSREDYRQKENYDILRRYVAKLSDYYIIPEGGTSELAVKGCEEILTSNDSQFDYVCVSVGTGGTLSGIVNSLRPHQTGIGFSALKGTFQKETITKYCDNTNFDITDAFCFGGYAKIDSELVRFINKFKSTTGVLLDPVYTGKMMFGILKLMEDGYFKKNSRILAIHTGGLQGIVGMNLQLKKKNLPQIEL